MSSIFNALNIGYSGLKTSQIAVDTTGHNIANAQNPDYTRQRTVITPQTPLNTVPGDVGLGAKIQKIIRIHDEFIFKRLSSASNANAYDQYRQEVMDEISSYFPEIDKNGVYSSLQDYFDAWNDFSKNPDDISLKINLAEKTRSLAFHLSETYKSVQKVQMSLDERLKTDVDEINRLGEQIAKLNKRINQNESTGGNANDLRDQRDKMELALSKLVDIAVSKGNLHPDKTVDRQLYESGDEYHLNIGGSSFVDGSSFHPLEFKPAGNGSRYGNIFYRQQDGKEFNISDFIHGGEIGSILSLRGRSYSETEGKFKDGILQNILDKLDAFASSLIVSTNNIYAGHAVERMEGNYKFLPNETIANQQLPINNGSFVLKVYNNQGDVIAQRAIDVDRNGKITDIKNAINADKDDNGDNVKGNDLHDFIEAEITTPGPDGTSTFAIHFKDSSFVKQGYRFAIEESRPDQPTDFAGALGLSRFFDGWENTSFYHGSADRIRLATALDDNPTQIGGNAPPVAGDNQIANRMMQLQYDKVDFYVDDKRAPAVHETLGGFYRHTVSDVASKTATVHSDAEASEALLTAVVQEFDSVSKVDIDEELTNLMKYQTAYGASAKVISSVDQMIQTLLGIKQ